MKTKYLLTTAIIVCTALYANAQTTPQDSLVVEKKMTVKSHSMNFIKVNLTSLALKTYSLQYERVLNKSLSLAVSFRTMPVSSLPFKSQILELIGDDEDTKQVIDNVQLGNMAITPELRFYVSQKGYGQGFYIAPFYRFAKYKTNNMIFTYESDDNDDNDVRLSGELTSNTFGIMFGAQWAIGKHLCLDWWILGPHYGTGVGKFAGSPMKPLTDSEQEDLRTSLLDFDIPLTEKTVMVNANSASMTLDGPWAGIRAGISFGFKF